MVSAPDEIGGFFEAYPTLEFKKRETILRAGDTPGGVYFLKKGYARLYSLSPEGKELTLHIYKPGDYFPIVWIYKQTPGIYYFETYTPVVLKKAPREDFLKFMISNQQRFLDSIRPMITRFEAALKRMEYLAFGRAEAKIASIFGILARDFSRQEGGQTHIEVPLTHRDVASLVGITREATSLEIEKLIKKGVLAKTDHHFVIPNMEALKRESLLE